MSLTNRYIEVASPYTETVDVNYWASEEEATVAILGYLHEFAHKIQHVDADGDSIMSLHYGQTVGLERARLNAGEINHEEFETLVRARVDETNNVLNFAIHAQSATIETAVETFKSLINQGMFQVYETAADAQAF